MAITEQQKSELRRRGLSDDQIARFSGGGVPQAPVSTAGAPREGLPNIGINPAGALAGAAGLAAVGRGVVRGPAILEAATRGGGVIPSVARMTQAYFGLPVSSGRDMPPGPPPGGGPQSRQAIEEFLRPAAAPPEATALVKPAPSSPDMEVVGTYERRKRQSKGKPAGKPAVKPVAKPPTPGGQKLTQWRGGIPMPQTPATAAPKAGKVAATAGDDLMKVLELSLNAEKAMDKLKVPQALRPALRIGLRALNVVDKATASVGAVVLPIEVWVDLMYRDYGGGKLFPTGA
jgi:hypothetical protein